MEITNINLNNIGMFDPKCMLGYLIHRFNRPSYMAQNRELHRVSFLSQVYQILKSCTHAYYETVFEPQIYFSLVNEIHARIILIKLRWIF